jgi:hypothetical protein
MEMLSPKQPEENRLKVCLKRQNTCFASEKTTSNPSPTKKEEGREREREKK